MSVPVLFAFLCVWWKININLTYCSRLLPYVKLNVEKQLSSPKLKQSERQFRKLQILTWHLIKDLPSIWGCILSFWKVQWGSELLCWGTEIGRGGQCLRSPNIGGRGEDQEVEGGLVQDWDWRHRLSVTAPLPTGSEYSLELDLTHPVFLLNPDTKFFQPKSRYSWRRRKVFVGQLLRETEDHRCLEELFQLQLQEVWKHLMLVGMIGQKLTKPCPQRRRRRRKVRLLWTRCSKRFMLMQSPTLMGALHHDVNSNLKATIFYIIFCNASITLHICHSEMQRGFCALSTTEAPLSVKWFASRGKRVFPDRDPTQHQWTFRMFPNGDF